MQAILVNKEFTPSNSPYTGGGLITKRFPLLCKEGPGVVVRWGLAC